MARRSAPLSSMCVAYACRSMCGDAAIDTRKPAVFYYEPAYVRREQGAAALREQQRRPAAGLSGAVTGVASRPLELAAAALDVAPQRGGGLVADRHDAHLAALAADDQLRLGRLDVSEAQRHELHAAQAAPVEQARG